MNEEVTLIGGPAHGQTRKLPLGINALDVAVIKTTFGDPQPYRYEAKMFRLFGNGMDQYEDIRVMAPKGTTHADIFKKMLDCVSQGCAATGCGQPHSD